MNAGPGRPSGGGGGGRRRRRGRRHTNQRGQRPGSAQARHNQDGIYTAPMDHSYRAALAGNNNGQGAGRRGSRPGFGASFTPADPEPLPVREDANSRIFAFVDDLFFATKIQETARKLNVKVEFVKNDKDFADRILQNGNGEEKPSLIIFDLNNVNAKPLTLDSEIEVKAEEGHFDYRISLARTGRSQAESPRSRLRHGSAAFRLLAEPASTIAPPRSARRRKSGGPVGNSGQTDNQELTTGIWQLSPYPGGQFSFRPPIK